MTPETVRWQRADSRRLRTHLGCPGTSFPLTAIRKDDVGSFFADHVNGHHNEESWDIGEDGSVHDAKILDAADSEIAVQHRVGVVADLARPASVMSPGLAADEFPHLIGVIEIDI